MRKIDTSILSDNECWGVQINGLNHCQDCKWIEISACEGKNIRLTGKNTSGYRVGDTGVIIDENNPEYDKSIASK